MARFSTYFTSNSTLETLDIDNTGIDEESEKEIVEALAAARHSSMRELLVGY